MDYFKKIERSVTISADKRSTVDLQVDVWSQDLNVTKFILKLDTTDSAAIDLANATVRVAMVYSQDGKDVKIEAAGIVEDVTTQKIAYVMGDRLAGFEGQVTAGFYVTLSTGQRIDIQNVTFNMRKSLLDKDLEAATENYYQTFDDIVADVQQTGDAAKTQIADVLPNVQAEGEKVKTEINAIVSDVQSVGDTAKAEIKATLPTLQTQVSELSESIIEISNATTERVFSENVHNLDLDENAVLNADGKSLIASQTQKTTAFIPVKTGDVVYLTARDESGNFWAIRSINFRWIAFYTEEKLDSCIGIYAYQNGYVVPEGAKYMRCTYVIGTKNLFEITLNWYPTRVEQQAEYHLPYTTAKNNVNMHMVDCWGDSRTEMSTGTSFTDYLNTLLGDKFIVSNCGISSQSSGTVAMRLGALDVFVSLNGNKIPQSGEVLLNDFKVSSNYPLSVFSFSNTAYSSMILNGINGRFVRASTSDYSNCKFERFSDGIEQTVRPKTKLIPYNHESKKHICVFWFGKNDFGKYSGTPVDQIIDNYKRCVDKIGHDKFVILGETCSIQDSYKVGGEMRAYMDALNNQLKELYPNNFIDINAYLSSTTALKDVGLTATATDNEYISNGFPAYQLMRISGEEPTDLVHPSTKGREAIAYRIYNFFVSKGWAKLSQ